MTADMIERLTAIYGPADQLALLRDAVWCCMLYSVFSCIAVYAVYAV